MTTGDDANCLAGWNIAKQRKAELAVTVASRPISRSARAARRGRGVKTVVWLCRTSGLPEGDVTMSMAISDSAIPGISLFLSCDNHHHECAHEYATARGFVGSKPIRLFTTDGAWFSS